MFLDIRGSRRTLRSASLTVIGAAVALHRTVRTRSTSPHRLTSSDAARRGPGRHPGRHRVRHSATLDARLSCQRLQCPDRAPGLLPPMAASPGLAPAKSAARGCCLSLRCLSLSSVSLSLLSLLSPALAATPAHPAALAGSLSTSGRSWSADTVVRSTGSKVSFSFVRGTLALQSSLPAVLQLSSIRRLPARPPVSSKTALLVSFCTS